MIHLWSRLLRGDFATSLIPHAAQVAPLVIGKCTEARSAIGTALTYIDTQQARPSSNHSPQPPSRPPPRRTFPRTYHHHQHLHLHRRPLPPAQRPSQHHKCLPQQASPTSRPTSHQPWGEGPHFITSHCPPLATIERRTPSSTISLLVSPLLFSDEQSLTPATLSLTHSRPRHHPCYPALPLVPTLKLT